jgi:hypothetical protein
MTAPPGGLAVEVIGLRGTTRRCLPRRIHWDPVAVAFAGRLPDSVTSDWFGATAMRIPPRARSGSRMEARRRALTP